VIQSLLHDVTRQHNRVDWWSLQTDGVNDVTLYHKPMKSMCLSVLIVLRNYGDVYIAYLNTFIHTHGNLSNYSHNKGSGSTALTLCWCISKYNTSATWRCSYVS